MKFSIFWIPALLLTLLVSCRTETEAEAHQAYSAAFERQETALEILQENQSTPGKALAGLKALRRLHGDAIIDFRNRQSELKLVLREEDSEKLGKNRDRLFEELNTALTDYPASMVKEIRYLLQTL